MQPAAWLLRLVTVRLLHARATGHSHAVGAAGGLCLRRGRCPPSPPTRGRWGAASGPPGRCAAAPKARTRAPSAPSYGPADTSCGLFRGHRHDSAHRGACWWRRPDRPRPWRRRCRRSRRRRRCPRPPEPPERRFGGLRGTHRVGRGRELPAASASGPESSPSGARRVGRGQTVTHGHADAGGDRGCASVANHVACEAVTEHIVM